MPRLRRLLGVLAVVLGTVGCAKEAAPAPEELAEPENVNVEVGQKAPDIVGEDVQGQRLKLSDFRGKVVVLDFWRVA